MKKLKKDLPNQIKISAINYLVIPSKNKCFLNGRECYAMINFDSHVINIDTSLQTVEGMKQSLIHEILHGIVRDRDIEIKNEEKVVESFAKGLYQLFVDNPLFLNCFLEVV